MLVQKYNVKSSAKLDKLKRQLCKLFCYHTYILQGISYGLEKFERAIVLVMGISTIIWKSEKKTLSAKKMLGKIAWHQKWSHHRSAALKFVLSILDTLYIHVNG